MVSINESMRFRKKDGVEMQKIDNDYILFLHDKNKIVNLNSSASFIWSMILDNSSFKMIERCFIHQYSNGDDNMVAALKHDVTNTVLLLLEAGAIELVSE